VTDTNLPLTPLSAELTRHGLLRRILRARRWYGADWWMVAIGGAMAAAFVVVGVIPGAFAPHHPQAQAGPRLLAPFEESFGGVMIVLSEDTLTEVTDLAGEDRVPIGIVAGSDSGQALRDEADRISDEARAAGSDLRVRLRINRYETPKELLEALMAGDVRVAAAGSDIAAQGINDHPGIRVAGPITEQSTETFPLGTNQIGQDILSRIIWGTRIAVLVGFVAPIISICIGVPLGLIAGFSGGRVDRLLSVLMDSVYAFPSLILAIAITAVLGPSLLNVIVALGVVYVPTYFRVIRGQTLITKELLHVEAARSLGARSHQILRSFITPNVIPSAVILFSVSIADAILTGAGLSFLGLGLPPDVADWGRDLARGQASITEAWWLVVIPGAMITLIVLSFTLLGEGLVEIFNPKLRDR